MTKKHFKKLIKNDSKLYEIYDIGFDDRSVDYDWKYLKENNLTENDKFIEEFLQYQSIIGDGLSAEEYIQVEKFFYNKYYNQSLQKLLNE